jgi:hypothetical protein
MKKLRALIVFLVLFSGQGLFSQTGGLPSSIIFYGAVSNSSDTNIINLTEELLYTQLQSFSGYTIVDRRELRFSADQLGAVTDGIVFYAEIIESSASWECTLHADIPSENKSASFTKKYDTYYRILTDARASLSSLFDSLGGEKEAPPAPPPQQDFPLSLASLAGNWSGGSAINKVVILRGGRGFVIYKNGATMNIEVRIEDSRVIVVQTGKPNASFYPDLPRDVALAVAKDAPPIEWNFSLTDADTLTGAQKTVRVRQNAGRAEPAEIPAVWKRRL